jgi:phage I-like protein/2'-5' RNA ligase
MAARYEHIDFKPPQGARDAAKRALEVRAEKPESERGMTPVGLARARDLSSGKTLSPETVRRMKAYFDRHEGDKSGETWGSQGKGWQAWNGWGGDAGYAWARKVVRQMDAADAATKRMSADASADGDPGVAVVLPIDEETAEYALPGVDGAHVTLAYLGRLSELPPGAVSIAGSVVAAWSSSTPALPARFSGVGRFHGDDPDDADAVYLSVDAPGLSAARDNLCRALRAAGLPVASSHGFTPHATLCYVPRDAATPESPVDLPLALTLSRASVWCGDSHGPDLALVGHGDPATMRDGDEVTTLRADGAEITCRDAAKVGGSTVNQIARFGDFRGHAQGAFKLDASVFAEIVRNFRATKNRRVPLDYEHTSEVMPDSVAQHGVPALAWITDLDDRGDGTMWATFEWVDPVAVEHVRAKRYLYLSPAIQFGARDKETGRPIGARLTSVALTNKPFLDGMAPVTASEGTSIVASVTPAAVHVPDTTGARRKTMDPEITDGVGAQVAAELPKLAPSAAPVAAPADAAKDKAEKEAAAPSGDEKRDGYGKFARDIAMACGMNDFSPDAEGAEDMLISRVKSIMDQLSAVQERERAQMQASAAAMCDRVIAAGLARPTAKDHLAKLCLSDRDAFNALYPVESIEEAEKRAAAPKAPAADAAPVKLSEEVERLLTTHVTAENPPPPPVPTGESVADAGRRRDDLAKRLLSEGKAKTYVEALYAADHELHGKRRADAVRPFAG